MRTTIAALGGISMMVVGIFALSEAASQSESTAMQTEAGGEAWNVSTTVFDGVGQAAGPSVVMMGVAAVILVALGVLVASSGGGR